MIPVLYEKTGTKNNLVPIGALVDVLSATVTRERNGIYEATITYPANGQMAEELQVERLIYLTPGDGMDPQPMEIKTITAQNDNTLSVYTQHISYRLSGMVAKPFTAASATEATGKLQQYMGEFTLTTDIDSTASFGISIPTAVRSVLGGTEGSLLDVYGGEFVFDGWEVHWLRSAGSNQGVLIAYGKNLTDISAAKDTTNVITGVLPYYQQQNEDGTTVTIAPDDPVTVADSGMSYDRITVLDCSSEFDTAPSVEQLQEYAENWLKDQTTKATDSVTLSYLYLYQQGELEALKNLEMVRLCDIVTVWDKRYNLRLTAKVVQTVYDPIAEHYDEIQVGEAKSNFADTVLNTSQVVNQIQQTFPSRWQQSMYELAQKITGQTDSHVIFSPMEYPAVIIIAENTDLTSAGNSALYLSSAGLAGTDDLAAALQNPSLFKTAITIDGQIIGERITGLTIEGQQIVGGIIKNKDGSVWIDLTGGEAYVPRIIAVTDKGGECYGIEQGTFNLSGAEYKGIRFFRMINVAPPFDSPEGDYFQVLRGSSNPYGYVRLRAINSDGNDVVIDLIGDNGTVSGSGDILQVRADSTLSIKLKLTQDGWLSVPGGISFGPSAGVGGSVGLTGGRLESGGNFVSNNGGFYAQMNGTNKAWIRADGEVHGDNLVATNAISAGVSVSARNGNFSAGVVSADYRMTQDGNTGLVQFTNNDFGIMYTGNVHFCITRNYNGSNETMIMLPNGANRDANNYCNWNWNGYQITNARVVSSSDARIKKYITASKEKALPIIDAIPVCQYTYKKGAPECLSEKKVRFGQIAQELYDVYPEAVVHDEDKDEWYIDKMALIDPLIKAVQELSAKVTSLESELKKWKENANAG